MKTGRRSLWFKRGLRDGIPIFLGYLAVSFTMGIAAKNAGLTALQAALTSITNNASAGQFAGFNLMVAGASYVEMAAMMAVTNARYLLMSCALSQKLPADTPLRHRLIMGWDVTDEIFSASMAIPGQVQPWYFFGLMAIAMPGWAGGTYLGVLMGNLMPANAVRALSVGLYGMFLSFLVPAARKSRVTLGVVLCSMGASLLCSLLPLVSSLSGGTRTILLTVLISGAAAVLFPVEEDATDGQ